MENWLDLLSHYSVLAIDATALVFVLIGTIEAFFGGIRSASRTADVRGPSKNWVRYGHWLLAALAFQVGADIIETAVAPSWDDIGRLGAIAAVRTFLDYFLKQDLKEIKRPEGSEVRSPGRA